MNSGHFLIAAMVMCAVFSLLLVSRRLFEINETLQQQCSETKTQVVR